MLVRLDVRDARADLADRLGDRARPADDLAVTAAVTSILDAVRTRGDAALRAFTAEFDHAEIDDSARQRDAELEDAVAATPAEVRDALEVAGTRIRAYHKAQADARRRRPFDADGVTVTEAIRPVDRAGLYVPGGRAAYPSTVLMTAIPAAVAGRPGAGAVRPAGGRRHGRRPVTLAAAFLTGVEEVYRVGGAQAVAAMAYGTESIAAVDVIVGPGNAYVDAAKRIVASDGRVGIDGPAGPSELVVIADATADPRAGRARPRRPGRARARRHRVPRRRGTTRSSTP